MDNEIQSGLAVVASWMSRHSNLRVVWGDLSRVMADMEKGIIYLPKLACASGVTDDALNFVRGMTYHEAGHIVFTKIDYNQLSDPILHHIWNHLEDRRMERAVADTHAGAGDVFRSNWHVVNKKIARDKAESQEWGNAPIWESLSACQFQSEGIAPAWRLSQKAQDYFDVAYDTFCEWRKCINANDALILAKKIYDILKQEHERQKEEAGSNEGNESQSEGESNSGKKSGNPGVSDFDDSSPNEDTENGEENEANEEGGEEAGDKDGEGDETSQDDMLKEIGEGKDFSGYLNEQIEQELGAIDPEDASYLSDKNADEHQVIEFGDSERESYKTDRGKVSAMISSMVNSLQQILRSRAKCHKSPSMPYGKLDMRRLHAAASGASKNVFYKTRPGEKLDTAVEIVIDESGSMHEFYHVRLVVIAISESLAQLGIPFEVTGSTTKYMGGDPRMPRLNGLNRTNPIVFKHYKVFNENWHSVGARITKNRPDNHNIDGEVVEYAGRRLAGRKESRKIIFSICDGEPESGQGNNKELGANIKRVAERCRKSGIEVYAISIDTDGPVAFYGKENSVIVKSSEEGFGENIARSFTQILSKRM